LTSYGWDSWKNLFSCFWLPIGIPSIAETVILSIVIVIIRAAIGIILVAFYMVLSVKAKRLADTLDEERKRA
jgi:hypothetical protein